ncbi:hypothetical protein N7499_003354 [Penicillium canescens]|uniref:Aminoglycoside phosphotransferase domain-containing protein n=1 Tax=Penicillium canescens TaxID=5083 RepID=A0AAD6I8M2_PENCN|nr:uncharacterized protein N7446_012269 [Penicillium canescens]KAJ6020061.1 hypothetical protein N7522_000136 [Penicillium canescens]KAJ6037995.1 hypothetical protein N7460_007766 [Penicillium canescens]KAJ6045405.1 hypothetical protein N7446_012269 [Penicillium canescens]KAJ6061100.1 hypothetical protein N7444_001796 [Penicillium canescens]KAJ6090640.1 hypothetical protein N7499_003354 [Penicillium canescens]
MATYFFRSEQDEHHYDPAAQEAEKKEITTLIEKIDILALTRRASSLRGGLACSVAQGLQYDRALRSSVMGGMNYHIEILFEDGKSWLARIRRFNATSPPPELRDYILRSEVSTLQFLSKTKVPVPTVFDFNADESNPVGVGYILMEKLPGKSLRWSITTPEQRQKIASQLADIYIELKSYPFSVMGSFNQQNSSHVGPIARESLTDFQDLHMKMLGPYSSSEEYFTAHIRLILDLIIRQESYVNRPVDAFLIHRFLLEIIPKIFSRNSLDDGMFYLKHADEKGDQILVDNDYNITGIIDWEWAQTDSKSAAFNSPIVLLPVADFYEGADHIGEDEDFFAKCLEEKGHPDLGEIVRNGRLLHRIQFCCGYDLDDWDGFIGLFFGLLKTLGIEGDSNWETWKAEAMESYRGDFQLKQLLKLSEAE